ncbi:MAG: hypothetical protein AB7G28_07195 [Pirellulales bacterium]
MTSASTWIMLAGMCQFGILIASAAAPQLLDWKHSLAPLKRLNRQLIWTHGAYIAGSIAAFGLLSVVAPQLLTDGSPLARIVCGFIAVFWGVRLLLQWFVFDPAEHVTTFWLAAGYHTLTVVFLFVTCAYAFAAINCFRLF